MRKNDEHNNIKFSITKMLGTKELDDITLDIIIIIKVHQIDKTIQPIHKTLCIHTKNFLKITGF